MARQVRTGTVVVLLLAVIGFGPTAAGIAQIDVLVVNDGHSTENSGSDDVPPGRYISRYVEPLKESRGVAVDTFNTTPNGRGPNASYMAQYDAVVWYTLADYGGSGQDSCGGGSDDCSTFYGEDSTTDFLSAGADIANVSQYLLSGEGGLLATGHNLHFDLKTSTFEETIFGVKHPGSTYYECKNDCSTNITTRQKIGKRLRSPEQDPITKSELFGKGGTIGLDTDIEPYSVRDVFMDVCHEDAEESYLDTDQRCSWADDSFRWIHQNYDGNGKFYAVDADQDSSKDDYAHSLVRTNRSRYKTAFYGVGIESIVPAVKRQFLLNRTIFYLAGPQANRTAVTDTSERTIGETGTVTVSGDTGDWRKIRFDNNYTEPVVIGRVVSQRGDPGFVFEAKNVSRNHTWARFCEAEATADTCGTHSATETGAYMVVDAADTDDVVGIEAGTVTLGGNLIDWPYGSGEADVTMGEAFSTDALVLGSTQSVNGHYPISVNAYRTEPDSFRIGMCKIDGRDACKVEEDILGLSTITTENVVDEEIGWIGVDPKVSPFMHRMVAGFTNSSGSDRSQIAFNTSFSDMPTVFAGVQTLVQGDQLPKEASIGMRTKKVTEVGYCDLDDPDRCGSWHWLVGTDNSDIYRYNGTWTNIANGNFPDNTVYAGGAGAVGAMLGAGSGEVARWDGATITEKSSSFPGDNKVAAIAANRTHAFISTRDYDHFIYSFAADDFGNDMNIDESVGNGYSAASSYGNPTNGEFFMVGFESGTVYRVKSRTSYEEVSPGFLSGKVKGMVSNGTHFVVGDQNGNIGLYNGESWTELSSIFSIGKVKSIGYGRFGNRTPFWLVGGENGNLEKLYINGTHTTLDSTNPHSKTYAITYSPVQDTFLTGGQSGDIAIYNRSGFFDRDNTPLQNKVLMIEDVPYTYENREEEAGYLAVPEGNLTVPAPPKDYPKYTNDKLRLDAACVNQQIKQGGGVSAARYFASNTSSVFDDPIDDSFERDRLDPWITSDRSEGNISGICGARNPGSRSLHLASDDGGGLTVTSRRINLRQEEQTSLTYYVREAASCDEPEGDEPIFLQYRTADGTWERLRKHAPDSRYHSWQLVTVDLPAEAFHPDFRLRFSYPDANSYPDVWLVDDVRLTGGIRMFPDDGSFGGSSENLSTVVVNATETVAVDLRDHPRGVNNTYAVQCRDTSSEGYWGPSGTDWAVVDTVAPNAPQLINISKQYTANRSAMVAVRYRKQLETGDFVKTPKERRADLVRFSCDEQSWSAWRPYPYTELRHDYRIDVTANGCPAHDGNRTIHVQVRDYAGNVQTNTVTDWIVFDTQSPNITGIGPENQSAIAGTRRVEINATDYRSPLADAVAGIDTEGVFTNDPGSFDFQLFTVNESFDPDYTASGDQALKAFLYDNVNNTRQTYLEYLVDLDSPHLLDAAPANTSALRSGDSINVTVVDETTNISRLAIHDGTSWHNSSAGTGGIAWQDIDPGWSTETRHTLTVWFNDSVDHIERRSLWYYIDNSPPIVTSLTLPNASVVQPDEYLNATFADQGQAGIFAIWGNIHAGSTQVVNNTSLIRDQNYIRRQFFKDLTPGYYYRFFGWSNDTLGQYNRTVQWYLVDDTGPTIEATGPDRQYINGTENISITVADSTSRVETIAVYNETRWLNKSVKLATTTRSLDPGWTTEESHEMYFRVNDSASNVNTTRRSWKLDTTAPIIQAVTARRGITVGGQPYINATHDVSLRVKEPNLGTDTDLAGAGNGFGVINNETTNRTIPLSGNPAVAAIDPGWTVTGNYTLQVWVNDTVHNTNAAQKDFSLDTQPPVLARVRPSNTSFLQPGDRISIRTADRGPGGGVGDTGILVIDNGTQNRTVQEGTEFDPGWTSEQNHTLIVWKNDSLQNRNTSRLRYTVDGTPPQSTDNHTGSWSGWRTTNKTVAVNTTDNIRPAFIFTCIDTGASCTPRPTGAPNVTATVGCPAGATCTKYIRYRANDSAGNVEDSQQSINISIDKQNASITFQDPEDGDERGGVIEFDTRITDAGAGVQDATYSIVNVTDGVDTIVRTGDLNDTAPWSYNTSWDSTSDTVGRFTFNVSVTDGVGHTTSENITINVDNAQPTIGISEPADSYHSRAIPIKISANRPGGTLKNHSYRLYDNNDLRVVNWSNATAIGAGQHRFEFAIDIASIEDGNYTLNSTAWDNSDRNGWSSTWLYIDTVPPTAAIESPQNNTWHKDEITGTYSISDGVSINDSACRLQYRSSTGVSWSDIRGIPCGGSSFTFDTERCDDDAAADCQVRIRATDQAGNTATDKIGLKIDNSPPTASFEAPEPGAWFNDDFTVSTNTADQQGLKNTSYRVNGGTWRPMSGDVTITVPTTCSEEGHDTCGITINATNYVNTSTVATQNVSIDTSRPDITDINPSGSANISNVTDIAVFFDASAAGRDESYLYNGSRNISFSRSGDEKDPGWTRQGGHDLVVWITDKAGNTLRRQYQYTVDDVPPTVTDITPANTTPVRPEVAVTANVFDATTATSRALYDRGGGNQSFSVNKSFVPDWPSTIAGRNRTLTVWLEDYAGNIRQERYRYFVDGLAPSIELSGLTNDTVIRLDRNLTLNATDAGVGPEETGRFQNEDTDTTVTFPLNESFDPGWTTEGAHWFQPQVNDTLDNRKSTGYRFVLDGTPPIIHSSSVNASFVSDGEVIEVAANVTETYSSVDTVTAALIGSSDNVISSFRLDRFRKTDRFNASRVVPSIQTQNVTVNISANDTLGHLGFDDSTGLRIDSQAPQIEAPDLNITASAGENYRVLRDQAVRFKVNLSDDTSVIGATATLNTSWNPATGSNYSLRLQNGTTSEGVWTVTFTGADRVGEYNITRMYVRDRAGNTGLGHNMPLFRVVNHSINITAPLGGNITGGTNASFSLEVDLNRTMIDPAVRIRLPAQPNGTPLFTNTSALSCAFGDGACTVREEANGSELTVAASGTGSNITVSADFRAPTPFNDTSYRWRSTVLGNTQATSGTVKAPKLEVPTVFCDATTNCTVSQNEAFNLTLNVTNRQDGTHTGDVPSTTVKINDTGLDIMEEDDIGELKSGETVNTSFEITIPRAGRHQLPVEVTARRNPAYSITEPIAVRALDTVPPTVTDPDLANDLVSIDDPIIFDVTVLDNVGVERVTATVNNTTGPPTNHSFTLRTGNEREGIWRLRYDRTDDTGLYNITDVYVFDGQNNSYHQQPGAVIEIRELLVNISVNETLVGFSEPVKFGVNFSGNTTAVSKVTATVQKPRGASETVRLGPGSGAEAYSGTYRNVSRSGNYTVSGKVTLANGLTASAAGAFTAEFGRPTVSPLSGNGTHLLLPASAAPYNLTWVLDAIDGDSIDINTSIEIDNTSVIRASGNRSISAGNATVEGGPAFATFNISLENKGTTSITVEANSSRNRSDSHTVKAIVSDKGGTKPAITAFEEFPDTVNRLQDVVIQVNASALSPLQNITLVVSHPDNGTGYVEDPVTMEAVDRGRYRYRFQNTTETGHYTYNITAWDIAGTPQRNVSRSFDVSQSYTVDVDTNHDIFIKGETARFNLNVTNVNGDRVTDVRTDFILNKAGENTTVFRDRTTMGANYKFAETDPPTFDSPASRDDLPLTYTAYFNVTKDGNSGFASTSFSVSRILQVGFIKPTAGAIPPNTTFELRVRITGPRGNPVGGKFTENCPSCPPASQIKGLTTQGNGIYNTSITTPSDEEKISINVYGTDGFGNSMTQTADFPPFISIDIGTDNTSGDGGAGGPGFGGGGRPALGITRLSPSVSLPPTQGEINLSVRTSRPASCRYGEGGDVKGFDEATVFGQTGQQLHATPFEVSPASEYTVTIFCRSDGLNATSTVQFIVQEEEIASFTPNVPSTIPSIPQGAVGQGSFSVLNNGTTAISVVMQSSTDCCSTHIESEGLTVRNVTLPEKSERSFDLVIDVPLNTSLGTKTVQLSFDSGTIRREKTVNVEVTKSPLIERLEQLEQQAEVLRQRIRDYRQSGIDTASIRQQWEELNRTVAFARTAIRNDDRQVLETQVEQADRLASNVEGRLNARQFKHYVLTNWWKWVLQAVAGYLAFFLITMVFIPYFRIRTEYLQTEDQLQNAIDARKKAEKQYFKRQIDRDTFMNIMTEQQDEILELRSKRDELEEELETAIRDRLTVGNFVKAPVRSFREIARWWQSRRQQGAGGEEASTDQQEQSLRQQGRGRR